MTKNKNSNVIDAEVISVEYDDDKPKIKARNVSPGKQGLVNAAQRHLDNLSPARKAALSRILKKAGIVGMATYAASLITPKITDQLAGEGDHKWACKAPEHGRTQFYPVTGNGNYDDAADVDKLDSLTADLNAKTFGYDSESIRSFHNFKCVDGCVDTITEPSTLTADVADKYFAAVHDAYGDTISDLNSASDEPWVQTLIQQRYGTLSDRQDEVQTISQAAGKMLGSTNSAAEEAQSLLRNTIRKTRADLAHGYTHGQSGFSWTATAAGAAAGLKKGIVGAGIGAVGAGLVSGLWGDHFPDDIKEALDTRLDDAAGKAKAALGDADDDVERFNATVADFGGATRSGEGVLDRAKNALGDVWGKVTDAVDGIIPDHIPGVGDGINPLGNLGDIAASPLGTSPSTDSPSNTSPSTDSPSDTSPGAQTPTTATPTSPRGNVQTPSMGTPSMSSPLGSMQTPSMGTPSAATPTSSMMTPAAFDSLMGNQPEATPELFEGTEVPLGDEDTAAEDTDKSDDDKAELTDPQTVDSTDDSPEKSDDTSDGEVVTDENGDPVTTPEPAAPEPTDEQKRTVQLPDGKTVTFPNEKLADMVRTMAASNPENPVSLYDAADRAGFQLPPMGTDIGQPVPPMDVQPGDVVKGADGTGVAIGNGEVLMESGEVKPIEEVAKVDSAGHGIFRLETTEADAPAPAPAAAPEQPVVPPPAAPAPVTEQPAPPAPVVGDPAPAAPPVTGDPLDLLAAV
ncbi:hypothetical protein [Mycolicibacterium fallax]|nr:hypothetical protein [Mycolicibacterium fallax]BBY98355.1 hypothetical protein MFAL_18220 [Mycolicibacterium fallax]